MEAWTAVEKEAFGARLRAARQAKGMTLVEVGAMFDTSKQTVQHWEAGRNMPSAEQVARLAREYGRSLEALVYGVSSSALSDDLMSRLAQADEETRRRLENMLRGHFDLEPLPRPADQAPAASLGSKSRKQTRAAA